MRRLNQLVAPAIFACLWVASGKTAQIARTQNIESEHAHKMQAFTLPLNSMDGLDVEGISDKGAGPVKIQASVASYRGRRAVRIVNDDGPAGTGSGGQVLAVVKTSDFKDGTIEAEVAGFPRQGAKPGTRGFIGIAFRVQDQSSRAEQIERVEQVERVEHDKQYEAFYLRMTNGRADDQLQRNHSAQYVSQPDFPWNRLRDESPGVYESYVDLSAGAWTRIKIVVAGTKAQLYINDADQPCLIVNDLKLGETHGKVALWTGSDTEAYFSNLKIR
jgi:hypothetical protein